MCGIAGTINLLEKADRTLLEKASHRMSHRGPDDEGFFFEGPVGLAHRRLSIIDLDAGNQPMFNEDQKLVVVFNGEIYNHIQLRKELESSGHIFSTYSDTEVILHGYEQWGKNCVKRFYGMFAFAIYNRIDKSIFISRDRCGEKPLYYFHDMNRFLFASEISALLELIGQKPDADLRAIYLYLRLGYIPTPLSFFQHIRKLRAGCSLIYKDGQIAIESYYTASSINHTDEISENELCDELDKALSKAVKRMLVSDVPLGAFLSGGLDSSLITAIMAKEGEVPKTFSISFDDASFDESSFAISASNHIGTMHTNYRVSYDDLNECISIMKGFGEPFSDSSGIPTFYLSRETRKEVTVALSGDGGDELFGGYRRYFAQGMVCYYHSLPSALRNRLIPKLLSLFPDGDGYYADSFVKTARIFTERAEASVTSPGLMINTVFSHDEVMELFPDLPDGRALLKQCITNSSSNKVEALMHADRCVYLPDDILVKVDRMSMKNSLEVRTPFLDPDILAISDRIPLAMKIKGINLKYLLKKVALRYLPPNIVNRKKHGFMVPMAGWIKNAGENDIRKRMPRQLNANALDSLLSPHFEGLVDNAHKIFSLIMLGSYLETK